MFVFSLPQFQRSGVQFPQRSSDAAPIFTPPVTHPTERQPQAGYGMPINSTRRLDEAMATEIEHLRSGFCLFKKPCVVSVIFLLSLVLVPIMLPSLNSIPCQFPLIIQSVYHGFDVEYHGALK